MVEKTISEVYRFDASRYWVIHNLPPEDKLFARVAIHQLLNARGIIEPFWDHPFANGELLPGYSAIVSDPMWLSLAIKRFESEDGTVEGLIRDIHLMFQNAVSYTLSTRRKSAIIFLKQVRELYKRFCKDFEERDIATPTLIFTRPIHSDRYIQATIPSSFSNDTKRFKTMSTRFFKQEEDEEDDTIDIKKGKAC